MENEWYVGGRIKNCLGFLLYICLCLKLKIKRRFITFPERPSAVGAKAGDNTGRARRDEPARAGLSLPH